MRVLHTSDWHVGKAIRGRSRADEHQAVLAEIALVADRESADLVVVAGDLFETATPTAESERIVYRALLDLAAGGRPVVVVAGNHDSAARLAAVAPLSEASGVHVASAIRPPADGGLLELDIGGEKALVALMPFPSQRYVVTADLLMGASASVSATAGADGAPGTTGDEAAGGASGTTSPGADAAEAHAAYADRVRRILATLTAGFGSDTINLVVGHLMVLGGMLGGGERGAHTVFDYWVPATAFPSAAQYVALGHLHRAQRIDAPAPVHYCGSPLQLDFGETANEPVVNLIDLRPGLPAVVRPVQLEAGRRLRTLRGTLAHLSERAGTTGDDHLRLVLEDRARIGLADEARELFPTAVEVVLAARDDDASGDDPVADPQRLRRTPHDLFAGYLDERDATDPSVLSLFDELVEDLTGEPGAGDGDAAPGDPAPCDAAAGDAAAGDAAAGDAAAGDTEAGETVAREAVEEVSS